MILMIGSHCASSRNSGTVRTGLDRLYCADWGLLGQALVLTDGNAGSNPAPGTCTVQPVLFAV